MKLKELVGYLPYKNIEKAFENHIDIFGLIPRGLAYDKHILEK